MCRVAMLIFVFGGLFGLYSLGPPVYWRVYATVLRPFHDNPSDNAFDNPSDNAFSAGDDPFAAGALHR